MGVGEALAVVAAWMRSRSERPETSARQSGRASVSWAAMGGWVYGACIALMPSEEDAERLPGRVEELLAAGEQLTRERVLAAINEIADATLTASEQDALDGVFITGGQMTFSAGAALARSYVAELG